MADKESPPWLLGVFTFALLCLVFGSLARTRGVPATYFSVDEGGVAPMAPAHVEPAPVELSPERPRAPQRATGTRERLYASGSAALPEHRSAAPSAADKRDKLNSRYQERRDGVLQQMEDDAEQLIDEGRASLQPRRLHPGQRAQSFRGEVLPWVTELSFALLLGIMFGFLTRLEMAVAGAVTACFSLLVIYLEWREYTDIHFAGLGAWAKAAIWNPVSQDTLRMMGGKVAAVIAVAAGWFMGTKG
ncbi:MAG: hypothetical protein KC613_11705 [Myxococcales bacterium]|nr:hypothetical protein [Myxococcales bacterium]